MGATAITVVAGARIVQMENAPVVNATRGLIAGTSVLFWTFGSWLIPPLVAAGVGGMSCRRSAVVRADAVEHRLPARHVQRRRQLPRPGRSPAARPRHRDAASWVALAAWSVTFAAMNRHLARGITHRTAP